MAPTTKIVVAMPGGFVPDSGVYIATRDGETPLTTGRGALRAALIRGHRAPPIRGGGHWVRVIDVQPND